MIKQYVLIRNSNNYEYLRGVLLLDNEFVSDTLELGNHNALEKGIYKLILGYVGGNNQKTIFVCNDKSVVVAKFVSENCIRYKNIVIREFNSNITVGIRSRKILLENSVNYLNYLTNSVIKFLNQNIVVELIIKDAKDTEINLENIVNEEWNENNHL